MSVPSQGILIAIHNRSPRKEPKEELGRKINAVQILLGGILTKGGETMSSRERRVQNRSEPTHNHGSKNKTHNVRPNAANQRPAAHRSRIAVVAIEVGEIDQGDFG